MLKTDDRTMLLVSETSFYGGGEKFIEVFLELMDGKGLAFAIADETLFQRLLSSVGANRMMRLDMNTRRNKALSAVRLVVRTIRLRPSRIVLNGLPSLPILLAAVATGREIFIIVHTAIWNYHGTVKWLMYRHLIENYCTLVFVASHLESMSLVSTKKATHVLQNRLLRGTDATSEFLPKKYLKRILFVGRGSKSKGIYELLDAAAHAEEFEFFIAGDVTEPDVAHRLAARNNVTALGFDKDIAYKLANFDLAVFPSHSEGFPYAVLEAAQTGLPIIASDIAAHREVSDLVGPFPLFAVGDAASLVSTIHKSEGFQTRSELSARLRKRSREFNDVATYRRELRAIFGE